MQRSAIVIVIGSLLIALSISGCGRRGALQPPPGASETTAAPPPARPDGRPSRPFVLDPLL